MTTLTSNTVTLLHVIELTLGLKLVQNLRKKMTHIAETNVTTTKLTPNTVRHHYMLGVLVNKQQCSNLFRTCEKNDMAKTNITLTMLTPSYLLAVLAYSQFSKLSLNIALWVLFNSQVLINWCSPLLFSWANSMWRLGVECDLKCSK